MTKVLYLLFFISPLISWSQTKEEIEQAKELGVKAVKLIGKGEIDQSIKLLKKAQKLDPNNIDYPYEIAFAYSQKKKYKKALQIGKQVQNHKDAKPNNFQLVSNIYDLLGQPDEAIKNYKEGLKRFPNSGKLYLEQGIVEMMRKNFDAAISYWIKGVKVDPMFASNYYWLSKIHCSSADKTWGVLFGELFINLERGSQRTIEISELIFDTYRSSIDISSDDTREIKFANSLVMDISSYKENDNIRLPFSLIYQTNMALALNNNIPSDDFIKLSDLNQIRKNFISDWYKSDKNIRYPNPLFDFQKQLLDKDYFDMYNYWLFSNGSPIEFEAFAKTYESDYYQFINWFEKNPIRIGQSNTLIYE